MGRPYYYKIVWNILWCFTKMLLQRFKNIIVFAGTPHLSKLCSSLLYVGLDGKTDIWENIQGVKQMLFTQAIQWRSDRLKALI